MTEQLAAVLSAKGEFEFKALFEMVKAKWNERKFTSQGDEIMRLRMYEKLQALVNRGMVEKRLTERGKVYRGLAGLASMSRELKAESGAGEGTDDGSCSTLA